MEVAKGPQADSPTGPPGKIVADLTREQVATLRPKLENLRKLGIVERWELSWPQVSIKGRADRAIEAVQAMSTWPEFSQVLDLNTMDSGGLDGDFGL